MNHLFNVCTRLFNTRIEKKIEKKQEARNNLTGNESEVQLINKRNKVQPDKKIFLTTKVR